ncbi:MAG: peptidylprolyl isomerase [Euryarchaeota archaeon]|nr:peptidylprolyl isomerase [Euryarchaeota archaeon]
MDIKKGDFIRLNYTGTVDGDIFDTTSEETAREKGIWKQGRSYEPITIRVGGMHVISGLDEDLIGKETGQEYEIEVAPDKAYGPHDESLMKSTSTKDFREKPSVGTRVSFEDREGVVVNIIGKRVLIDFNHPLAGQTLNYKYTIDGVIETTEEKAQAILKLFSGKVMDVEFADGVLTVILPPGITYDKQWMMGKGMSVHQIFEYIDDVKEVVLKDSFKRPDKPTEAEEEIVEEIVEAEEAEAEEAEAVAEETGTESEK